MSDAAVATVVSGAITISTMVIGFLTMWVKLHHAAGRAGEAADRAEEAAAKAEVVEKKIDNNTEKLDSNTVMTESVDVKADTIVRQTDGALHQTRLLIEQIAERVSKLEDHNRERSHRLFDVINVLGLKVERLLAVREMEALRGVETVHQEHSDKKD